MAHPSESTEAVGAPATLSMADAAAAFDDIEDYADEVDETTEEDGEDEIADEDLDPETDEESEGEDDGEDEPSGAIKAPVSLNASEKEAFAAATPEVQQAWAAAESRRNQQVQEATTKASSAQREAEARAAAADAQAKRVYAQQLDQMFATFEPQAPDPQLAFQDPQRYVALKAHYDAQKAQHDEVVQQVRAIGEEAEAQLDEAFLTERDAALKTHPKIANPETQGQYIADLMGFVQAIGFDPAHVHRNATGAEVLAIAKVYDRLTEAESKAAKWDQAMSRKMQQVRAGKQRTNKPGSAQPVRSTDRKASEVTERFKANPMNMAAAAAAFNDI